MKFNVLLILFTLLLEESIQDSNLSKPPLQTRVVGGKPARAGQFPYQAAILGVSKDVSGRYDTGRCSGTIISNRHILTAAHCFLNVETDKIFSVAYVFVGTNNITNAFKRRNQAIEVNSTSFILHEKYKFKSALYDIALITLPEPLHFNDSIRSAKLPKRNYTSSYLQGLKVNSSGWGKTNDDENSISQNLMYITSKIVPGNECTEGFAEYAEYGMSFSPESHICINSPGQSVCDGDSGGPNVIVDDLKQSVVVGVTCIASTESCTINKPQILTRVTYYLDWIHENTGIPIEN